MSEFPDMGLPSGLNEVQFPKELQREVFVVGSAVEWASMKCSSRRNCNLALLSRKGTMN